MMNQIKYHQTDEFKKDFKKLSKRFRTLASDLDIAKQYSIEIHHSGRNSFPYIKKITSKICNDQEISIYKLRRFACKSLGHSTDKIRLIYAYSDNVITFIEIYFKGDEDNENYNRIERFLDEI